MSRTDRPTSLARLELDFDKDPAILHALGAELGLGVFTVDAEGRFVGWSAGAEQITGYSGAEVRGQLCQILEGPNCKGFSGLTALLHTATPEETGMENQECRVLTKDSRQVHLLGSVRVLRDASQTIYGAVGVFWDLTEVLSVNSPHALAQRARGLAGLIGQSAPMEEVFRRIQLAADSDVTTLITGESGTGKELAARAVHTLSERRDKPFVAINCSAIPESLLESELFGHVKGAFTGAIQDRRGVFESANGGTLFLDEIGDVSPLLQLKLLRVLQEREVQPVGSEERIAVDVRLLTATHRDLPKLIEEGLIREDFYYRIRVFDIRMPALRERAQDIPLLAQYFVEQAAAFQKKTIDGIARDALEALIRYPWPGNVRELQNALEHALVLSQGATVGLLDLPEQVRGADGSSAIALGERNLSPDQEAERLRILDALDRNDWNRTQTAKHLGVSRVTLWKKIRRYQIDEGVFAAGHPSALAEPLGVFTCYPPGLTPHVQIGVNTSPRGPLAQAIPSHRNPLWYRALRASTTLNPCDGTQTASVHLGRPGPQDPGSPPPGLPLPPGPGRPTSSMQKVAMSATPHRPPISSQTHPHAEVAA